MHARVLVPLVAAIKAALSSQGLKLLKHACVVVEPAVYRLEEKTRAKIYDRVCTSAYLYARCLDRS